MVLPPPDGPTIAVLLRPDRCFKLLGTAADEVIILDLRDTLNELDDCGYKVPVCFLLRGCASARCSLHRRIDKRIDRDARRQQKPDAPIENEYKCCDYGGR